MTELVFTDPDQHRMLFTITRLIQQQAIDYNRHNNGCEIDPFESHLQGVISEYAVHMHTGIPWHAFRQQIWSARKAPLPDLGDDIDVKTTTLEHGNLIVQKQDDPRFRYVHTITWPKEWRVRIIGFVAGSKVMREEHLWCPPNKPKEREAYFYRGVFRPVDDLLRNTAFG